MISEKYVKEKLPDGINVVTYGGDVIVDPELSIGQENESPVTDSVDIEPPQEVVGVSISIDERALALKVIIDYFNQASKVEGIKKIRRFKGNTFDKQYKNPDEVEENAVKKAERLRKKAEEVRKVLIPIDKLREAGFSEAEILKSAVECNKEIHEDLGGAKNSKRRKKVAKNIKPKKLKKSV